VLVLAAVPVMFVVVVVEHTLDTVDLRSGFDVFPKFTFVYWFNVK